MLNLLSSMGLDSEVVFLDEEGPDAVVVKEQVRLVVQAHRLLILGAEHLAANVPRTLTL